MSVSAVCFFCSSPFAFLIFSRHSHILLHRIDSIQPYELIQLYPPVLTQTHLYLFTSLCCPLEDMKEVTCLEVASPFMCRILFSPVLGAFFHQWCSSLFTLCLLAGGSLSHHTRIKTNKKHCSRSFSPSTHPVFSPSFWNSLKKSLYFCPICCNLAFGPGTPFETALVDCFQSLS